MTNKFLLNLLGFNPDLTSRQSRVDGVSILSRQSDLLTYLGRIAAILVLVLTIGVGNAWGADQLATWTASNGALGTSAPTSGTIYTGSYAWSYSRTLSSGESSTGYNDNSQGAIRMGKNGGVENISFTTSAIPGTIKSISVVCASYQANHSLAISVGGTSYFSGATPAWGSGSLDTKTGTGTSSGTITISFTGGTRALYVKSISVTYNNDAPAADPYTVSFSTGTGNPSQADITEASGGAGITLPAGPTPLCSGDGWSFAGWKESSAQSSAALPATKLWQAGETYFPAADITLYAVYFKASGNNYEYIDNLNSLFDGAKMIITAYNSGDYAVSNTTDGDGYIYSSSVSPDGDDVISSPANSIVWTLKGYKDNWTLKNVGNNKYIIVSTRPALADVSETFSITYEVDEDDYDQFNIQKGSKYLYMWNDNSFSGYNKTYLYFYQQQGIYNSNPTCCTPLGTINGSFCCTAI